MFKSEELSNPDSCFNKAHDNEMIFVLLGRDVAAAKAVRAWCHERLRLKKNNVNDPQIREAFAWANTLEESYQNDDVQHIGDEPGMPKDERMAKWFAYEHLPEKLQHVSRIFHDAAVKLTQSVEAGPERTVALRKILEAKDAAVRAALNPGG